MAIIEIVPGTIQLLKMTDAEYFSEKYREYISNSRLGLIDPDNGGSPEKYAESFKSSYSESFELGSAIHAMVLQPDYYHIADINKPTGKLGLWAEEVFQLRKKGLTIAQATSKAAEVADYYASNFSKTRLKTAIKNSIGFYKQRINFQGEIDKETIFLSAPMKFKFEQCMLGIAENTRVKDTLYPQGLFNEVPFYNEYAILCEADFIDEDTGEITRLKLKGKMDNYTVDDVEETITLNDLKSSGKPAKYFMGNNVNITAESGEQSIVWYDGSFQKYHYGRQCGVYLWLLQCAIKELYNLNYKSKVNIVVIETIPDFKSKVYPVNGKQIKEGLAEFKRLLTLVVEWMKT